MEIPQTAIQHQETQFQYTKAYLTEGAHLIADYGPIAIVYWKEDTSKDSDENVSIIYAHLHGFVVLECHDFLILMSPTLQREGNLRDQVLLDMRYENPDYARIAICIYALTGDGELLSDDDLTLVEYFLQPEPNPDMDEYLRNARRLVNLHQNALEGYRQKPWFHNIKNLTYDYQGCVYWCGVFVDQYNQSFAPTPKAKLEAEELALRCLILEYHQIKPDHITVNLQWEHGEYTVDYRELAAMMLNQPKLYGPLNETDLQLVIEYQTLMDLEGKVTPPSILQNLRLLAIFNELEALQRTPTQGATS